MAQNRIGGRFSRYPGTIEKNDLQSKKGEKRPWRSVNFSKGCNFTKSNTPSWVFFTFLNCTNRTKLHKASHM